MRYVAYLLRLWEVEGDAGPTWRASLESPHTGERQGFVDHRQLFAFLEEKMNAQAEHEETEGE